MKTAFIRALWGNETIPRSPKVWEDVAKSQNHPIPVECEMIAYGTENSKRLTSMGIKHTPVGSEGLRRWPFGTPEQGSDIHLPFGVSTWRHKLEAIWLALHGFDAVVWLDLDCRLARPLPGDFWETLAEGPELQAALTKYKFPKCKWREEGQAQQYVPSGSWVYCRGLETAAKLLDMQQAEPRLYDEQIYAKYTDELMGGWTSPQAYKEAGFEPANVTVHRGVFRDDSPSQLFYAPLRQRD